MTKPACRLGNQANYPTDSHGGDCCPHNVTGPAVSASPDVFINGRPALRVGDTGVHSACCGAGTWVCVEGSGKVKVNGLPLVRLSDATSHCGGSGTMIQAGGDGPRGFNELTVEDKAGQEEIYLHGEKDVNIHVKNDRTEHILHDKHRTVDRHTYVRTEGETHETLHASAKANLTPTTT